MTQEIVDLTNEGPGCSDNPVSRLIKILREGSTQVLIKIRKTDIPFSFAKIFAKRYGYEVSLISENEDEYLLEFQKQRNQ
ncbi:MAG: hypothetical protein QW551_00030 [Desulfurococcaceae archaeon]